MARRFIIAVVTLTLLWTGTLLHDIFTDTEHHHSHFVANGHSHFFEHDDHQHDGDEEYLVGAQISDSESETDGGQHCHGPSVVTTIDGSVNGYDDSQDVLLPFFGHWKNNHLELLTVANFSRPPPLTNRQFQTRLYLVNRTLLI